MNTKFNIEVPFFQGFYESIFYNSDTLSNEVDDELMKRYKEEFGDDITEGDIDIHFDEYKHDVSETYVEVFSNLMDKHYKGFLVSAEYEGISSPREYNFRTDRVFADITLADDWHEVVQKFIEDNREWLGKKIKNEWSSYDGFMSFMSNDICEWEDELAKDETDERYISCILGYMLYAKDKHIKWNINEATYEDVYISEYLYCTKEKKAE